MSYWLPLFFFFFLDSFFLMTTFIYLFFGCVGSSFLCEGFLQLWQAGATLHCGARASHYRGLSSLRSTGCRRAGSVAVAHGPSCSAACGIFPDQGSNPCPLHWQADSQPLRHQGSPGYLLNNKTEYNLWQIFMLDLYESHTLVFQKVYFHIFLFISLKFFFQS